MNKKKFSCLIYFLREQVMFGTQMKQNGTVVVFICNDAEGLRGMMILLCVEVCVELIDDLC